MRAVLLLLLFGACGRIAFDERGPDAAAGSACVIELGVGVEHACALLDDGGVWCWGRNDRGQLGNGTITEGTTRPARVLDGPYTQLVAGSNHTCALRRGDGGVECWGNNGNDQVGAGSTLSSVSSPVVVPGLVAEELTAGSAYACARTGDAVQCWGDNDAGELGAQTLSDKRATPEPIALAGVTVMAGGDDHACMGTANGMACWGINGDGQLSVDPNLTTDTCMDNSDMNQPCSLAPVMVAAFPSSVSAIGLGRSFSCVVFSGKVQCWGLGTEQQLGDGLSTSRSSPASVAQIVDAQAISVGKNSVCATLSDATVWCWGEAGEGALGTGTFVDQSMPVMVPALTGATQITTSPSGVARCALRGDTVACWGDNTRGLIPDAAAAMVADPTFVMPRCP